MPSCSGCLRADLMGPSTRPGHPRNQPTVGESGIPVPGTITIWHVFLGSFKCGSAAPRSRFQPCEKHVFPDQWHFPGRKHCFKMVHSKPHLGNHNYGLQGNSFHGKLAPAAMQSYRWMRTIMRCKRNLFNRKWCPQLWHLHFRYFEWKVLAENCMDHSGVVMKVRDESIAWV